MNIKVKHLFVGDFGISVDEDTSNLIIEIALKRKTDVDNIIKQAVERGLAELQLNNH